MRHSDEESRLLNYLKFLIPIYLLYAGIFILQSSVVVASERYFTLFEDGMISMRYAKNLAGGHGLVWNSGEERVEGITNLLWTAFMSIFHFLPVPPSKMSLLIQIAGALLLAANLFYVSRIAFLMSNGSSLIALCSVFLAAFYYPLNYWGLLGMEVSALALITSFCIWKCLKNVKNVMVPFLLLSIAMLIRIDMVLVFICFIIFQFFNRSDPNERRKVVLIGSGFLAISMASQTIFRMLYFGDVLPNTYYLKMTGYPVFWRIARGFAVSCNFLIKNWWIFGLAIFAVYQRRDRSTMLLLGIFAAQLCYSIYVGGDAWEEAGGSNRFLSIAIAPIFILYCLGASSLILRVRWKLFSAETSKGRVVLFTLIASLGLNSLRGPESWSEWLLISPPQLGAPQKDLIELALTCKGVSTENARAATALAGIFPYFFDRKVIDLLGKSDRVIAHQNAATGIVRPGILTFYPGHTKWDYRYGIEKLQPDIIGPLWTGAGEIQRVLFQHYLYVNAGTSSFYVKKSSKHILWDRIPYEAKRQQ